MSDRDSASAPLPSGVASPGVLALGWRIVVALLTPGLIWGGWAIAERYALEALQASARVRFELYRASVGEMVAPFALLPAPAGAEVDATLRRLTAPVDTVLVLDRDDGVLHASQPGWSQRGVAFDVAPDRGPGTVILDTTRSLTGPGGPGVRLAVRRDAPEAPVLLVMVASLERTPWRLMMLAPADGVTERARAGAIAGALAAALLLLLMLYIDVRRQARREALAAQRALQHAHDELERRVHERTEAFAHANEQLRREVRERERAQAEMQSAQAQLVQAGKLAALGQMSAGITHELNQPLAALRTLSDNAQVLLSRGRHREVEANLGVIGQLVERMGKLTASLKNFARRSEGLAEPVAVRRVIFDALFLVERRVRLENVRVEHAIPEHEVLVRADPTRLGQVLVNLFTNALDAMAEVPDRVLGVVVEEPAADATSTARCVRIRVRDSGPGIPDDVLPRLFEPFYTTKPSGVGLGLGLAISSRIVDDFGGTLTAGNAPEGGAEFVVSLGAG